MIQKLELIITMQVDSNGAKSVQARGPLEDKFICYAMLEGARDAIKDYKPALIQPVGAILPMKGNGQ